MALVDEWKAQRLARQQGVKERQENVQELLTDLQQERQVNAEKSQVERQDYVTNLQIAVDDFLATTEDRRRNSAKIMAQKLDDFTKSLSSQTADFLNLTATERQEKAEQLAKDLQDFHVTLNKNVALLRQKLKKKVSVIQGKTHALLRVSRQERAENYQQLTEDLANFMESLRTDVQSYLKDLAIMRQERAIEINEKLVEARSNRLSSVQELFDKLGVFRQQLQDYSAKIKSDVWGDVQVKPAVKKVASKPPVVAPIAPPKKVEKATPVIKEVTPEVTVKKTTAPAQEVIVEAKVIKSIELPKVVIDNPLEKKIYDHISSRQGSTLVDIESTLGLKRIEAVDTIRSLMQKKLIVQRGRIYFLSGNS